MSAYALWNTRAAALEILTTVGGHDDNDGDEEYYNLTPNGYRLYIYIYTYIHVEDRYIYEIYNEINIVGIPTTFLH